MHLTSLHELWTILVLLCAQTSCNDSNRNFLSRFQFILNIVQLVVLWWNSIDDTLPCLTSIVLMVHYLVWPQQYYWHTTLFDLNSVDGTLPYLASTVLMAHYLVWPQCC